MMNNNIQIPFHQITIDDQKWYKEKEKEVYIEACDSPFASIFSWSSKYATEMAMVNNTAVTRYDTVWGQMYAYPIGGTCEDRAACVETLISLQENEHQPLKFIVLTENNRAELEEHFPGVFEIDDYRDRYDYVYEAEKLADLKGKKLAAKRNHIHRFEDGGEWQYEAITPENIGECLSMMDQWIDLRVQDEKFAADSEARKELEEERAALECSFAHFFELGLRGGLLRREGKVIAFTAGEPLNRDTIVVHYEKALPMYPGTYQVINQQFIKSLQGEFRYVNREDDAGDLGLRKAKLSYYPDLMVKKYVAVQSNVTYAAPGDIHDICRIWNEAFGDGDDYVKFYMEHRFTADNMMVIRRDGHVASMISFWPASIKCWDHETNAVIAHSVMYAYAVATDKKYRCQGMAAEIMAHAAEKYRVPIVLQPANEQVRAYYRKIGFEDFFREFSFEWNCCPDSRDSELDVEIITEPDDACAADYITRREMNRRGSFISWDTAAVRYAFEENRFCGGRLAQINGEYALYHIKNDSLIVSEFTGSDDKIEKYLKALAGAEHVDQIKYVNAGGQIYRNGCSTCFESRAEAYIGLTIC